MTKYLVMCQCFDTPEECLGDYYLDMINDVFDTEAKALDFMNRAIEDELKDLTEEYENEASPRYYRDGNTIYNQQEGTPITAYWVQQVYIPIDKLFF